MAMSLQTTDLTASAETLAQRAVARLQADILSGALAPGGRLRIEELRERYGIGATPLREALSRLVPLGLVHAETQRGFRVAPASPADLDDLMATRTVIETEALRLSMVRGGDDWESEIVAALHVLLKAVAREGEHIREPDPAFDALHKRLHKAFIAACGSPRLIALQDSLYDQTYRYRRLTMPNIDSPDSFAEEHRQLAALVLRREPAACEAMSAHLALLGKSAFAGRSAR
jgi:GntR family carbon starvation induced transcriptional regulator